jgi:hypothetical protein
MQKGQSKRAIQRNWQNKIHKKKNQLAAFDDKGVTTQNYVIKFVSDLRQVGGFLRIFRFPPLITLSATI